MYNDIRHTQLYQEAEQLIQTLRHPRAGLISDACELDVSVDGSQAVFSGTIMESFEGVPATRICQIDLNTAKTQVLSVGPNTDRLSKFSPDGTQIAFLSDRHKRGDFQLYFLDNQSGAVTPGAKAEGWVENFHWCPEGKRILVCIAGHGADTSSGQGAVSSHKQEQAAASWLPEVQTGDENYRWRSLWFYDLATHQCQPISPAGLNIWEMCWCGYTAVAAIASSSPAEADWYTAAVYLIDIASRETRIIYTPKDQLGCLAASPSGKQVAVVEAVCSDRGCVAGDLLLIESETQAARRISTHNVDISHTQWRSEQQLFLAGHRGFESVVLELEISHAKCHECWASTEITSGGVYLKPTPIGKDIGDCLLVGEGFLRPPELARVHNQQYRAIASFDCGKGQSIETWVGAIESIEWSAPDGLKIQGWLLLPQGEGPYPLVMDVHGGPVWHWRPRWLPRSNLSTLMLLKKGYAIFLPNPRGSSGRGQAYAREVQGDLGGKDTQDFLSGLDALVMRGIADPKRIGVTGGSYGGFMTSWLITQDSRFAAAVPVAPVTHWASKHLTTYIPAFDELFLNDKYNNPDGRYHQRSPVMHAHKAKTPTLHICGALDRCTPPGQAMEFHNALLEDGVESVLVTYPEEGHGVRKSPAVIDYATRVVAWIDTHMAAK